MSSPNFSWQNNFFKKKYKIDKYEWVIFLCLHHHWTAQIIRRYFAPHTNCFSHFETITQNIFRTWNTITSLAWRPSPARFCLLSALRLQRLLTLPGTTITHHPIPRILIRQNQNLNRMLRPVKILASHLPCFFWLPKPCLNKRGLNRLNAWTTC